MNLLSLWQNITKGNMEYEETSIKGVWILTPKVFNDNRGYFFEAWKKSDFEDVSGAKS